MAPLMVATAPKRKQSVWRKMDRPNLYRYLPKGTFYFRGRAGGGPDRVCLHTTDYALAVDKLEELKRQRRTEQKARGIHAPDCIPSALEEVGALIEADPSLRAPTKDCYRWTLARMKPGKECAPPAGPLNLVGPKEIAGWWAAVAKKYAPTPANRMLAMVRQAVARIRKALPFIHDPTADLKRVKVPQTRLELLTAPEFRAVVDNLREMRQGQGKEAADYVEFMAYSGLRPKELAHLEWRDIHEPFKAIEVWGGPDRTKNGTMRRVPIIPRMETLLKTMREKRTGEGKVFQNNSPRAALNSACDRLGFKRQRIYDLRHLFATTCLESGVDVPTFAGWLGHKDKGALAMRTYVHPRDDHRDRMAAKVTFA